MNKLDQMSYAHTVCEKWKKNDELSKLSFTQRQDAHDLHMLKLSKHYSKLYSANVFKLNRVSTTLICF